MKGKNSKIKIFAGIIVVLIFVLLVIILKSVQKNTYSVDEITKILKDNKFSVVDKSSEYASNKTIEKYLQSKADNNKYQVDYFLMDTNKSASDYYNKTKKQLEIETSGIKGKTTTNKKDYSKYILESSGNYLVMIRVENTIIYINTNVSNKEDVNKLLKTLSY